MRGDVGREKHAKNLPDRTALPFFILNVPEDRAGSVVLFTISGKETEFKEKNMTGLVTGCSSICVISQ